MLMVGWPKPKEYSAVRSTKINFVFIVKGLMGQNYEKTEQNGKMHPMCVQNLYLCETKTYE